MNYGKIKYLLVIIGAVAGTYFFLKYVLWLAAPFVFSYLMCCLVRPLAIFVCKKWPFSMRTVTTFLLTFVFLGIVGCLVLVGLYVIQNMGNWQMIAERQFREWPTLTEKVCRDFVNSPELAEWTSRRMQSVIDKIVSIGEEIAPQASVIFGKLTGGLFIGAIGAYLLGRNQYALINALKENTFYKELNSIFGRMNEAAGCFVRTQLTIAMAVTVIVSVGLFVLQIPHAILWGIFVAFVDALPILGSGMVLGPWAVYLMLNGCLVKGFFMLVIYGITAVTREVLEPKLMGHHLQIHPFYMFMATIAGIRLFGIPGILTGPLGLVMVKELIKQLDDMV